MKKLLSIVLAMAMVLALGVTAFAAEGTSNWTGSETIGDISVEATYETGATNTPDVYHVILSWTSESTLKYSTASTTYQWSTTDLKYTENTDAAAGWSGEATVTVIVENRSNKIVTATVANAVAVNTVTKADMTWTSQNETQGEAEAYTNAAVTVNTAAQENHGTNSTAGKVVFTGTLKSEDIEGTISAGGAVATITVTLSK